MKIVLKVLCSALLMNVAMINFSSTAFAQEEKDSSMTYDDPSDLELSQKARMKLYPGGKDEGDIKVQTQLVQPQKKFGAQQEEHDAAAADD